jgi:hypothetical protein
MESKIKVQRNRRHTQRPLNHLNQTKNEQVMAFKNLEIKIERKKKTSHDNP